GLFWHRPALALTFTAMLLSLAGIPMTLGFIAKFYAVTAGVGAHLTAPVAALVTGSIIGLYYYLRLIVVLIQSPSAAMERTGGSSTRLEGTVVAVLLATLIVFGVYPAPLVNLIQSTAG